MAGFRVQSSVSTLRSRSRQKRALVALSAVTFLICAAGGTAILVKNQSGKAPDNAVAFSSVPVQPLTATVLVPAQEIIWGTELVPQYFRIETRPIVEVPASAVRRFEDIQGQYAKVNILPGTILLNEQVQQNKPATGVSINIPLGYRAVSINVNALSSVEGWVRPGSHVDVAWASSMRGEPGISVIVENAQVLSVERQTDNNPQQEANVQLPNTVTLLLTEGDAQKVHLALTSGSMALALRGDGDNDTTRKFRTLLASDLLGRSTPDDSTKKGQRASLAIRSPDGSMKSFNLVESQLVVKK